MGIPVACLPSAGNPGQAGAPTLLKQRGGTSHVRPKQSSGVIGKGTQPRVTWEEGPSQDTQPGNTAARGGVCLNIFVNYPRVVAFRFIPFSGMHSKKP